jgi:hypothetical protein
MHHRAFRAWLQLTLEQQGNDFHRFLESAEGTAANLRADGADAIKALAPEGAKPEEMDLFVNDLVTILRAREPRVETREAVVQWSPEPAPEPAR